MTADELLRCTAVTIEVERLADELLAASQSYRRAKDRFARITARYGTGPEAELHARGDYGRQRAGAHCEWHGTEMVRLGTALLALAGITRDDAP
jgi:hypothetical protein